MKYPPEKPNLPIGNLEVADRNFDRDKENKAQIEAAVAQQKK